MTCSISTVNEKPYVCEKTLGEETYWVGFPVNLAIKKDSFEKALIAARALMDEYCSMLQALASEECKFLSASEAENYGEFGEVVDFLPSSTGSIAKISKTIIVEFDEGMPFWQRMELVSRFLDKLSQVKAASAEVDNLYASPEEQKLSA